MTTARPWGSVVRRWSDGGVGKRKVKLPADQAALVDGHSIELHFLGAYHASHSVVSLALRRRHEVLPPASQRTARFHRLQEQFTTTARHVDNTAMFISPLWPTPVCSLLEHACPSTTWSATSQLLWRVPRSETVLPHIVPLAGAPRCSPLQATPSSAPRSFQGWTLFP